MEKRLPALRIAMRIGRRKARIEGNYKEVNAITEALSNEDIQREVLIRLKSRLNRQMKIREIGDGSLLDWFLENWQEILRIILIIIGL